jgi:phosphoribosyl 1,2-cyclic phosphodiesterase
MNIALFASGSSGNCALVSDGETHILIDAGISARRIRAGLTAQDVARVLVTHEHSDHVKGLTVLLRRDPVAVYALPAVCAALRKLLPERTDCLHEITPGEPFCLGDVRVTAFPTPHDAAGSCGYRLASASAPTSAP